MPNQRAPSRTPPSDYHRRLASCLAPGCLLFALLMAGCSEVEQPIDARAVAGIRSQPRLLELARTHEDLEVRLAAIAKLTRETALAKVALEDGPIDAPSYQSSQRYLMASKAAVDRLGDQALVLKVALEARNWAVRKYATERLTDPAAVATVALGADARIREAAVAALSDQGALARVVRESEHPDIIWKALGKLTDPEQAATVAIGSRCGLVRRCALQRVTTDSGLAKIIAQAPDAAIRQAAARARGAPPSAIDRAESRHASASAKMLKALLLGLAREEELFNRTLAEIGGALLLLVDEIAAFPPSAAARIFLRLDWDHPALLRRMLRQPGGSGASWRAMAEIRLALHDPVVRRRLPDATATFEYSPLWFLYSGEVVRTPGVPAGRLRGESVQVVIRCSAGEFAELFASRFPMEAERKGSVVEEEFIPAAFATDRFLARLLSTPVFAPADLKQVARAAEVPVLASAAVLAAADRPH